MKPVGRAPPNTGTFSSLAAEVTVAPLRLWLKPKPDPNARAVICRPRQSNAPSVAEPPAGITSGSELAASWISLISYGTSRISAGQLQVKKTTQPRDAAVVSTGVSCSDAEVAFPAKDRKSTRL